MPIRGVQKLDEPSVVDLLGVVSFEEAVACERKLLSGATDLAPGASRVLIWRTEKSIIVPRGMPARNGFENAASAMSARGFPVFERDTGGDLTPQSPGVVNLSMVFRLDGANPNIQAAYLRLVQPVVAFLKHRFGINADVCAVPGAFCDGAYNIACGGKKLAGTAQRWRLIGGEGDSRKAAVLGHVALMADVDLVPEIEALNEFYVVSGIERTIELEKHATLAALAGRDQADPGSVADELSRFVSEFAV